MSPPPPPGAGAPALAGDLRPAAVAAPLGAAWRRAPSALDRALPRPLRPYAAGLVLAEMVLLGAHLLWPGVRMVDLDKEFNIPAWFSSLQLAALAAACFLVLESERRARPDLAATLSRWGWAACGLGFLYLSLDEACVIHEMVLRTTVKQGLPPGSPLQEIVPWQIVFAPAIVATFLVVCLLLHLRLERPKLDLALAGLGFWAASLALEGLAKALFIPFGAYRLEVVIEEMAEMLGTTCLLVAVAAHACTALAPRRARPRPVPLRLAWNRAILTAGALLGGPAALVAAVLLCTR